MKTATPRPSEPNCSDPIDDSTSSTRPGSTTISQKEPPASVLGDALMTAANDLIQLSEVLAALENSSIECEAFAAATLRRELEGSSYDLLRRLDPLLGYFAARTVRPSMGLRCRLERQDDDIPF